MKREFTATNPDPNGLKSYSHHFGGSANASGPHLTPSWDAKQQPQVAAGSGLVPEPATSTHGDVTPSTSNHNRHSTGFPAASAPRRPTEVNQFPVFSPDITQALLKNPEIAARILHLPLFDKLVQQIQPHSGCADNYSRQRNNLTQQPPVHNTSPRVSLPTHRNTPVARPLIAPDYNATSPTNHSVGLPSPLNDRHAVSFMDKDMLQMLQGQRFQIPTQLQPSYPQHLSPAEDAINKRPSSAAPTRTGMAFNSRNSKNDIFGASSHQQPPTHQQSGSSSYQARPLPPLTAPISIDPLGHHPINSLHPSLASLQGHIQQIPNDTWPPRPPIDPSVLIPPPTTSYSAIDILRESKQTCDFMRPTNSGNAGFGVPHSAEQRAQQIVVNQSDAVDQHFRMSLNSHAPAVASSSGSEPNRYMPPPPVAATSIPGVSSCSSSSSLSSMAVWDANGVGPGAYQQQQKHQQQHHHQPAAQKHGSRDSINDMCKYSLKKRLLQRYQADSDALSKTSEIKGGEFASTVKPDPQVTTQETHNPTEATNQLIKNEHPSLKVDSSVHGDSSSSPASNPSTVNSSARGHPSRSPKNDGPSPAEVNSASATRRQPPVRASKIAPLTGSLAETTTGVKRSRVAKHGTPPQFGRNRNGSGHTGTKSPRARQGHGKPRFYNSRGIPSDSASPSAPTGKSAASDQIPSDFDFDGQDAQEETSNSAVLDADDTGSTTNRKWFGGTARKRRSGTASGSPRSSKAPRKSSAEPPARKKYARRTSGTRPHSQRTTVLNAIPRTYAEDDDEDFDEEALNDDDHEKTIRAEEDEEDDAALKNEHEHGGNTCHKCGYNVKPQKLGGKPDRHDFQCSEEKIPLEVIWKRLTPLPDLPLLSHRSLCGGVCGDGGGSDLDASSHRPGMPFLQLNSCTELEKFKPSSRCRACREASKSPGATTVETSCPSTSAIDAKARRRTPRSQNNGSNAGGSSNTVSSAISVFCRFWGFRKLSYDNKGNINTTDFCRTSEADAIDRALWSMHQEVTPSLNYAHAMYILDRLGSVACRLLLTELSIMVSVVNRLNPVTRRCCPPASCGQASFATPSRLIAWKRPVQGVREMCDVCETTIFNAHWVCGKCGYSVCSACYFTKATTIAKLTRTDPNYPESHVVTPGPVGVPHEPRKSDEVKGLTPSIVELGFEDYSIRHGWSTCSASRRSHDLSKMMLTSLLPYGTIHCLWHRLHRIFPRIDCPCDKSLGDSADNNTAGAAAEASSQASSTVTSAATSLDLLADLALKSSSDSPENGDDGKKFDDVHYKAGSSSGVLYLKNSASKTGNFKAFQRHWATNQPVVMSECGKAFNASLWTPKALIRDSNASSSPAVLIDCETNLVVPQYPIRAFWDVFESASPSTRKSSSKDVGRMLQHMKIREWPTSGDLAEAHPDRYVDYADHIPIPEYTHREGPLNLASRLPSFFVRPDLGPRLHIAHDLTQQPRIGTFNLRVDVTDVVNVLLHVGRPTADQAPTKNAEPSLKSFLKSAGLDSDAFAEITSKCENISSHRGLPGALWHIFRPSDLPALRDYLTKLDKISSSPQYRMQGTSDVAGLGPLLSMVNGDIIHDQQVYLSPEQMDDLHLETGIKPYTVLQFLGDAIFIPAGSVHQVRTLAHCINVSSDFISPEHVPQCLALTEEFRKLPRSHPSHEDKLQVKNMIYHTVKDALSAVLKKAVPKLSPSSSRDLSPQNPGQER